MIKILDENKVLNKVLDFWISKNNSTQYEVHKNKSLIAIISLLIINPKEQHELISKNIKIILDNLIILVKEKYEDINDNIEEMHSEKTNFELDEEEKTKILNVNFFIKKKVNENDLDLLDDELEEDEDSEWDQLEFLNELTVVEKINPIIYLRDGFNYIQNNYSDYYENIINLIGQDDLRIVRDCVKKTESLLFKKLN